MKNEVERLLKGRGLEVKNNKNLTENLREWRKDRNIVISNTYGLVANIVEELLEIYYTDKNKINENVNIFLNQFINGREPISNTNTLDAIQDIQVFCINETELMGYDNIKCNNEVFKHINCRKQDPKQKELWAEMGANGKWLKDTNQNPNEIYEPNYESCKL